MANTAALGWADVRRRTQAISDALGIWEGVPVPVPDQPMRLYPGHPLEGFLVADKPASVEPFWTIRNRWYCAKRNVLVWIYDDEHGVRKHYIEPTAPDRSMARFDFWLTTLGVSVAWDTEAEAVARSRLKGMLTPYAWRCYDLTGSFLETSTRSRATYLFRRLRPTVVLVPSKRNDENAYMKCLAVMCLHPIGFYEGTWAGVMVPTDDVLAHLTMVRGDERLFWRKANQHRPDSPEAGL